jgi:hypothetical protein
VSRWELFLAQAQKDAQLWLFAFALLGVLRGLMLGLFARGFGPEVNAWEILKCLWAGARFDASVATYWTLPCLLATALRTVLGRERCAEWVRGALGGLFVGLSTLLGAVAMGFFAEYKDTFNHWVLGVVFDDLKAVLRTVWKDYPVIPALASVAVASATLGLLLKGVLARPWLAPAVLARHLASWPRRVLGLVCLIALAVVGARGSTGRRPVQLKDAAITKDRVLNKLVLNPYSALRYAVSQQLEVMRGSDLDVLWPGGDIGQAARLAFPSQPPGWNLDALTKRVAQGPPAARAQHLFLVIMESHDAWPSLDRYRSLRLAEGVRALARDGLLIPAFVSAGSGTMPSLGTLITGLPEAGLVVNYQPAARKPFPTSIAATFHRLGYRTRAFYAGYLSWQRFGDFCAEQGFDEIHGGGNMDQSRLFKREWGVEDDQLFDYVVRHVPEEPASFNLILSSGYHPPYTMDVFARGYPVRQMPSDLRRSCPKTPDLKVLGHLWFADRCLTSFVQQVERRLSSTAFAVTGDHWSRRFLHERPNTWERTAVLMLWRGSGVLPPGLNANQLAGSHLDILPTLIELAAPAGFTYHAYGQNLFDRNRTQIGLGVPAIVTPGWVLDPDEPAKVLTLPDMTERLATPEERDLVRRWQALRAVSWWRVMKGPDLGSEPKRSASPFAAPTQGQPRPTAPISEELNPKEDRADHNNSRVPSSEWLNHIAANETRFP